MASSERQHNDGCAALQYLILHGRSRLSTPGATRTAGKVYVSLHGGGGEALLDRRPILYILLHAVQVTAYRLPGRERRLYFTVWDPCGRVRTKRRLKRTGDQYVQYARRKLGTR